MPRAACPVKCEAYLTRVREEHHIKQLACSETLPWNHSQL